MTVDAAKFGWKPGDILEISGKPDAVSAATFGKPNQERDYHGRWGKGGKGSSTKESESSTEPVTGDDALDVADRPDILSKHAAVIADYRADYGYQMNALARGNEDSEFFPFDADEKSAMKKSMTKLDVAFKETKPLDKPIQVLRGVDYIDSVFGSKAMKPGSAFSDKGYTSTTPSEDVASEFGLSGYSGMPGGIVTIDVPKGRKALTISRGEDSETDIPVTEILLPRNSKFEVVSDTGPSSTSKSRKIHLKVVS